MKVTLTLNDGARWGLNDFPHGDYVELLTAMASSDGAIYVAVPDGIQRIPVEDIKGIEIVER